MNYPENSPFKLLEPYGEADRSRFFGRDQEIRRLAEALLQTKFLLLYGASGTGKTSLIQCGLRRKFSPRDWMPVFVRRGQAGFPEAIREALAGRYREAYVQQFPATAPPPTDRLPLRDLIKALFDLVYVPVYLILDQFEEIFTIGNPAEQAAFFQELDALRLFEPDLFCKLLLVVREEYIAHFYRYERDFPFLFEHRFRVEKMRGEQLQAAVQGTLEADYGAEYPAFQVDPGVPEQMVHNLVDDKSPEVDLTTLQVYLDRLYRDDLKRRTAGKKSRPVRFDLELVGSSEITNILSDFLDGQLEEVGKQLKAAHPGELKQIKDFPLKVLFTLVTPFSTRLGRTAEEIHREVNRKSALQASLPLVQDCLDALAGCRVLGPPRPDKTGEPYYELSHDRLAEQVAGKADPEEQRYQVAISALQNKWKQSVWGHGKKKDYLSAGELALIEETVNLEQEKPEFQEIYAASRRYWQRQQRRRQWVTVGAVVAAVVFGVLAAWAVYFGNKAAIEALYNRGLVEARTDPTKGLESIIAAIRRDPGDTAKWTGAYGIFEQNPVYKSFFCEQDRPLSAIAFSASGELAAVAIGNLLKLYRIRDTALLDSIRVSNVTVGCLVFKGSDTLLAGANDRHVYIFNGLSGPSPHFKLDTSLNLRNGPITGISFSRNGQWLCATYSNAEMASLYALQSLELVRDIFDGDGEKISVSAISPDGVWLVTGTADGALTLQTTEGGAMKTIQRSIPQEVTALEFSPDGNFLTAGFADGAIYQWTRAVEGSAFTRSFDLIPEGINTAGFIFVDSTSIGQAAVEQVHFSPDSRLFLANSADGYSSVFTPGARMPAFLLTADEQGGGFYATRFTDDLDTILTGGKDGTLKRWSFPDAIPTLIVNTNTSGRTRVRFTPDGKHLVVANQLMGMVQVYETKQFRLNGQYGGAAGPVVALCVGKKQAVFADDPGEVYIWNFEAHTPDSVIHLRFSEKAIALLSINADETTLTAVEADTSFAWVWKIGTPGETAQKRPTGEIFGKYDGSALQPPALSRSADASLCARLLNGENTEIGVFTAGGQRLHTCRHDGNIVDMSLHPNGMQLAAVDMHGQLLVWNIRADYIRARLYK